MKPAITLIELLVVIALVGIIAGTGWPTLTGWNCKQELRNDFESLNQLFEAKLFLLEQTETCPQMVPPIELIFSQIELAVFQVQRNPYIH